jgi:hypothetical protein
MRQTGSRSDLTTTEQANVRVALRFLRARCGGWQPLAKVLLSQEVTIRHIAGGKPVSASIAVRIARFVKVGIDDLLAGKYPPEGACPYCGHVKDPAEGTQSPVPARADV